MTKFKKGLLASFAAIVVLLIVLVLIAAKIGRDLNGEVKPVEVQTHVNSNSDKIGINEKIAYKLPKKVDRSLSAGERFRLGQENRKTNYVVAAKYIISACEDNHPEACFHTARLDSSVGGSASILGSLKLYSKSCKGGFAEACFTIGKYYDSIYNVRLSSADNDLKQIRKYYKMACDGDFAQGCSRLGHSIRHDAGQELNSKQYFTKACQLDPSLCR